MELRNKSLFLLVISILICQAHSDYVNDTEDQDEGNQPHSDDVNDTEDQDEGNQPTARIFSNLFQGSVRPFHPPYPFYPFPDGGDFGNPLYPNNFEYPWYLNPGHGEQPIPAESWFPVIQWDED